MANVESNSAAKVGRMERLKSASWIFVAVIGGLAAASCSPDGEKYTAGTLVVTLKTVESGAPVVGVSVQLFDSDVTEPAIGDDFEGTSYRSDSTGAFEHRWGWLGGGGTYYVRLIVSDSAYNAIDTVAAFNVRGTKEDNHLNWVVHLSAMGDIGDGLIIEDHSGFSEFEIAQRPGLTFCPDTNSVYRAEIERHLDGHYSFSGSVLRSRLRSAGDCADGESVEDSVCLAEVALPLRTLTPGEAAQVKAVFAEIRIDPERDPICEQFAIDPCRIVYLRWDNRSISDYVCHAPRLREDHVNELFEVVDALAPDSAFSSRR